MEQLPGSPLSTPGSLPPAVDGETKPVNSPESQQGSRVGETAVKSLTTGQLASKETAAIKILAKKDKVPGLSTLKGAVTTVLSAVGLTLSTKSKNTYYNFLAAKQNFAIAQDQYKKADSKGFIDQRAEANLKNAETALKQAQTEMEKDKDLSKALKNSDTKDKLDQKALEEVYHRLTVGNHDMGDYLYETAMSKAKIYNNLSAHPHTVSRSDIQKAKKELEDDFYYKVLTEQARKGSDVKSKFDAIVRVRTLDEPEVRGSLSNLIEFERINEEDTSSRTSQGSSSQSASVNVDEDADEPEVREPNSNQIGFEKISGGETQLIKNILTLEEHLNNLQLDLAREAHAASTFVPLDAIMDETPENLQKLLEATNGTLNELIELKELVDHTQQDLAQEKSKLATLQGKQGQSPIYSGNTLQPIDMHHIDLQIDKLSLDVQELKEKLK